MKQPQMEPDKINAVMLVTGMALRIKSWMSLNLSDSGRCVI